MQVYLVGGAVRDKLLGLTPTEHDWVVVGAQPSDLEKQGFTCVGKDFPVFLHPDTREEYALARTERKVAPGYSGFEFQATPNVTLEQDLLRRDLTINAIAEDQNGNLIDPYGGISDIKNRLLRHVSPAFSEDPVRVLRVARLSAKLAPMNFNIADETLALMRSLTQCGELDALVPERVWKEMERALATTHPQKFFEVLRQCQALAVLIPEIDRLFGVPQSKEHHPEIDTGLHTMMVLQQAARLSQDTQVRFAALLHDLGKGTTAKELLPKHIDHESRGVQLVDDVCDRIRIPKVFRDIAKVVTQYHLFYHRARELRPKSFMKVFRAVDAFRRPERLEQFILACEADARGRTGYENKDCPQSDLLRKVYTAANAVQAIDFIDPSLSGEQIGLKLAEYRTKAIAVVLNSA